VDAAGVEWVRAELDSGRTAIDRPLLPGTRPAGRAGAPGRADTAHYRRRRSGMSAIPAAYARWVTASRS